MQLNRRLFTALAGAAMLAAPRFMRKRPRSR